MMGGRAWFVLALTGCGRLGFDTSAPPDDAVVTLTAAVCSPHEWTTTGVDVGVDIAATATPAGVAVAWTHMTGSDVTGALLDPTMQLSLVSPVKVGGYVSSSLSFVDGMVVSAEVETGLAGIKYDTAQSDLKSASEFACPIASHAPKPAVLHAGPDLIAISGFDNGMTVWPIVNWAQKPSNLMVSSTPVTGMAATEVGPVAMVMWSTATTCHVALVTDASTGTNRSFNVPCTAPRVASDGTTIVAVYETASGVAIARGDMATFDASVVSRSIPGATSPHVVYDGTRFWLSYVDAGGLLVLGAEDAQHDVVVTSTGHSPQHAYDLAVYDGQVWVVAVDAQGLATDRMCLQ